MSFLQITGAEILLCLPLCFLLSKRTGLFSPASTSANFCLGCIIFAFVVSWTQMDLWALQVGGIAFPITASEEATQNAVHIYAFVVLLTFCSAWKIRKKEAPPTPVLSNRLLKRAQKLARRAQGFHGLFAPVLLAISMGHLFFVLLPTVNNFYFSDRSNLIVGPLLLASLLLSYYSLKLSRKIYFFLYLPCFVYSFAIMLGSYSRIIPLSFIVITVCTLTDTTIKKSWIRNAATGFFTLLTVFFMVYSLVGRAGRDEGLNYAFVWQSLQSSLDPANAFVLIAVAANIFHGVLLLAECIDISSAHYSLAYQWLSISPFPSFIDGWGRVADEQIRINIYTPFNSFGEAYFFGPLVQLALILSYCFSVRTMTRFFAYNFGWRRVFITTLSLFCWSVMHQYPLRNIFRFMMVAVIVCLWLRVRPAKTTLKRGGGFRGVPQRYPVPALRVARSFDTNGQPAHLGAAPGPSANNLPPR